MPPTQPNQAAQQRRSLMAVIQQQQKDIEQLRSVVAHLAVLTDNHQHPGVVALVTKVAADVATTDEQALQPAATDDPQNIGSAPAGANTSVTPDATTDVTDMSVVPTSQPANADVNSVDQSVVNPPSPDDAKVPVNIQTGNPTNQAFSSRQDAESRLMAALRLARARKTAGIVTEGVDDQDELVVAQHITDSDATMDAIHVETATLEQVNAQKAASTPVASRRLVPTGTGDTRTPSLASTASAGEPNIDDKEVRDDELGFFG